MKATLILADHARVSEGKLDVLGAGWTLAGPDPVTMGIGVLIEVPWDQTNRRHAMVVRLLGEDGQLTRCRRRTAGARGIEAHTEFEVGRPPGVAAGTPSRSRSRSTWPRCRWRPAALRVAARDRRRDPGRLAGHLPDPRRAAGAGSATSW